MSGAQHSPRAILAKAYRDNGDIGAANYIEAGHDLLPDTQVHLLAIRDALALSTTPSQGLDAATVERCAQVAENYPSPLNDLPMALAMRDVATTIRALATDPHQHGGKGA